MPITRGARSPKLARRPETDDNDRLAKDFIIERFATTLLAHDTGEWKRTIRAIAAPTTVLRSTFDLMPRDGEEAWTNIAARLHGIPAALDALRETYEDGRKDGTVAARRQAIAAAEQCATWADQPLVRQPRQRGCNPRRPACRATASEFADRAGDANTAYGEFASYLRDEYAPDADEADGCGPERYRVGVRAMLGADLDPQEMYDWAWTDFHYLRSEIAATCARIKPGAGFAEIIELLDSDPARAEHSADAYQSWLQALTDEALARSKEHFEIPAVMDRCEALLPPEGSAAAAYYTGPSEDFSRPGRTWYPTLGRSMFPRWGEVTHLLPRVGARPSSADRLRKGASRVAEPHSAQQLHPRPWRRLGALRRATVRRVRLVREPRLSTRVPRWPNAAHRARDHRHRHAPRQEDSRRHHVERRHRLSWRRDVDARSGLRVLRQGDGPHRGLHAQRDRSLPRLAGTGDQLQDRSTRVGRRTRRGCPRTATAST